MSQWCTTTSLRLVTFRCVSDPTPSRVDGRSRRWEAPRRARRAELIATAIDAIRRHGPDLGMDAFAAEAGTSKTVLYRYFGDRAGLHAAIVDRIEEVLIAEVGQTLSSVAGDPHPREVIRAAVAAFVRFVEREGNLYEFLTRAPSLPGAVLGPGRVSREVADQTRLLLERSPAVADIPEGILDLWAAGTVGLVRTGVLSWLRGGRDLPPEDVVDALTELCWHGTSTAYRRRRVER